MWLHYFPNYTKLSKRTRQDLKGSISGSDFYKAPQLWQKTSEGLLYFPLCIRGRDTTARVAFA